MTLMRTDRGMSNDDAHADAAPRVPRAVGYRLDGRSVVLPDELPEEAILVLTQQTRESAETDAWCRNARVLVEDVEPPVPVFRIVLIDGEVASGGPAVLERLRARLADPRDASHVIVLYVNVADFVLAVAGRAVGDRTTLALWAAGGRVVWQADGAPTPDARRELLRLRLRRRPCA